LLTRLWLKSASPDLSSLTLDLSILEFSLLVLLVLLKLLSLLFALSTLVVVAFLVVWLLLFNLDMLAVA